MANTEVIAITTICGNLIRIVGVIIKVLWHTFILSTVVVKMLLESSARDAPSLAKVIGVVKY